MSAALPVPSHTITGTGGESVTYSRTCLMVWGPPSITTHTTGVANPPPVKKVRWNHLTASTGIKIAANLLKVPLEGQHSV